MIQIRFINPLDQPTGNFRLLDWLESNFINPNYNHFKCIVAFAKVNPFYKLDANIKNWKSNKNSSEAIFGIDHNGTSYQALQYALNNFDTVRILHVNYSTFHPKIYIFYGDHKATAYCGSGNFTSGGLETNFESGVILEFDLPADQIKFDEFLSCYTSLISPSVPCTSILDQNFLNNLLNRGLLMDESKPGSAAQPTTPNTLTRNINTSGTNNTMPKLFGHFSVVPARPIPKNIMSTVATSPGNASNKTHNTTQIGTFSTSTSTANTSAPIPFTPQGFVIQLSPHHNGEIFLSKRGINQCPAFFGYPFSGLTTPKKALNPAYPQRIPDPIVNIRVFNSAGVLAHTVNNYNLNMVYYTSKAEIRITITPSILSDLNYVNGSTDYPILIMRTSSIPGCDYDMDFYAKGSNSYNTYLNICNQTLPSGGKSVARKMGWF